MNSSEDLSNSMWSRFQDVLCKNFVVVLLGFIINGINALFVYTFSKSPLFYREARYILYIHLVINDMIMLSISVTLHVLTYACPLVNASVCCILLMLGSVTHKNTPMSLSGMAIERYIAVCKPLHHSQICTVRRTYILIGLIWGVGFVPGLTDVIILLLTSPLTVFASSFLCSMSNIFNTKYHRDKTFAMNVLYLSFVWVTLFYTYFRVLFAARAATTDRVSTKKAEYTIALHGVQLLLCTVSYISPLIDATVGQINPNNKRDVMFSTYLLTNILPRFLTPFIYGVRDQTFLGHFRRLFCCKTRTMKIRPLMTRNTNSRPIM